jgi:hypothetical protein
MSSVFGPTHRHTLHGSRCARPPHPAGAANPGLCSRRRGDAARRLLRCWARVAAAGLLWLAAGSSSAVVPANFNHAGTGYPLTGLHAVQPCEACHVGGVLKGTPRDCESCHVAGARLARNNVVRPARHLPAVGTCSDCHGTQSFTVNRFNHNTVRATGCQVCHTGNGATGRTPRHIGVAASQACGDCHRSTASWLPASFNHTQVVVANRCFGCHDGLHDGPGGRSAVHVPGLDVLGEGIDNCDTCHKTAFGFTSWVPARVHQFTSIRTQCATCHIGVYTNAVGAPRDANHTAVPLVCEQCHRDTVSWSNVNVAALRARVGGGAMADSRVTIGGRVTPGGTVAAATALPPRHVPVGATAPCSACHRSATNLSIAVSMNHGAVRAQDCKACHGGAHTSQGTVGALAAGPQHIPYRSALLNGSSMDCDDCHRAAPGTTWTAVRMEHNHSLGGGVGSCKTCHQAGSAFQGSMEKRALAHVRVARAALDCSASECHAPLGRVGTRFRSWR